MKHTVFITILLILSMPWTSSCQDDDDVFPLEKESSTQQDIFDFLNTSQISLPDMAKTFDVKSTASIRSLKLSDSPAIDRESMRSFKKEETDIYLFSLQPKSPVLGLSHTRIDSKKRTFGGVAYFKLQIRKIHGKYVGRVMTFIPDSKSQRLNAGKISELGYDISGSTYSGTCLYSTLDGIFVYGEQYENGQLLFRFHPRISDHSHEGTLKLPIDSVREEASKYKIHVSLYNNSRKVRGTMYNNTESGEFFRCSICGKPADDCTCVTIRPDDPWGPTGGGTCWTCGYPEESCHCCHFCWQYPCRCDSGGGGSTSGGAGGGGGATGGGFGGGGSSSGSGSGSGGAVTGSIKHIFGTNKNLIQWQVNKLCSLYELYIQGKVGNQCDLILQLQNVKLDFSMNSLKETPASFLARTHEIVFKNNYSLDNSMAFFEEMTHALQYYGYYGEAMVSTVINYDFEAKLLGDIACQSGDISSGCGSVICVGMMEHSEYTKYAINFNAFINHVINNGWNDITDYTTYYNLCQGWYEYQKKYVPGTSYANASFSGNLPPKVLIDLYKKK